MTKIRPYLILSNVMVTSSCFELRTPFTQATVTVLAEILNAISTLDDFRATVQKIGKEADMSGGGKLFAYDYEECGIVLHQTDNLAISLRNDEQEPFISGYSYFVNKSGRTIDFLRKGSLPPLSLPPDEAAGFWCGRNLLTSTLGEEAAEIFALVDELDEL